MRKELTPYELENAMKLIGKDWMLVTASDGKTVNTMTASWGMMGVLWNKEVCTVFVRPQRYTAEFTEQATHLSLSFFDESFRDALKICGTKSGRDCDKWALAGLTPVMEDGVPIIKEAKLTLICRKLYRDVLREECFLDRELLSNYARKDYHYVYVCQIEKIWMED